LFLNHYQANKYIVAILGGNWNNDSNAGTFYWNLNNTSSNRNRNIGTHLLYVQIIKVKNLFALPLGKIEKRIKSCIGKAKA